MPLVVTRQLPKNDVVIHAVVMESTDSEVDDQDHYMHSVADNSITEMMFSCSEFQTATFTKTIIPITEVL